MARSSAVVIMDDEREAVLNRIDHLMEEYGPWDIRVGESYCLLGNIFCRIGKLIEASAVYVKGLEILQAKLSDEDLRVAGTRYNIGLVNCRLQRFVQALPYLEHALETRRKMLGSSHSEVADTLTCVGGALAAIGRHHEALERYDDALAVRRAKLEEEYNIPTALGIATILLCSSSLLRIVGKREFAKSQVLEAYQIFLLHLGADHPFTSSAARSAQLVCSA